MAAAGTTAGSQAQQQTYTATYSTAAASLITSVQFPQYYANGIVSPMNGNNYTGGAIPVQYWNVATISVTDPTTISIYDELDGQFGRSSRC
jgi:hypothetical protein